MLYLEKMNGNEDVMTKLEPRCLCCLCEIEENFSTEDMSWVIQDFIELPPLFKYVPSVFCVDCVAFLEQYKKFKANVEISFVTLEKLVLDRGLNKDDCMEMLELIPRVSPDPDAPVVINVVKPVRRLWKCAGRPRKDGTPAQPRFYKIKNRTPPVYDSDSYKSKSSDDENYCRRSDNEEWNPDMKNISLNNRKDKKPIKGKRGRPRKSIDDKLQQLENGIFVKSEQFNGNHHKIFVKRPRGRPPKEHSSNNPTPTPDSVKKKVLQKSYFNDNNISSNDEHDFKTIKKKRGRPKKDPLSTTIKLVNKKVKKHRKNTIKPLIIKSIMKRKRGRPPKIDNKLDGICNKKGIKNEISQKRKRKPIERGDEWVTEMEDEVLNVFD